MTLYRYEFLFKDMVSGVRGHGCTIQLEALSSPAYFNLKAL